jgi:hypothetical protein
MSKSKAVVVSPQALVPAFPTVLDGQSNRLPTIPQIKRLHGPLAFRRLINISAPRMRRLLALAGYELQHHQTLYTWERAERDPRNLPRGYWTKRYMPDEAAKAYHCLVLAFVLWATRGAWAARVTGKRVWRVHLRRTK